MKTTVEISDSLLEEARRIAAREGTSVRSLVEEGLRRTVAERNQRGGFKLRQATVKGAGLQPPLQDAGWDQIRSLAYEGHGG